MNKLSIQKQVQKLAIEINNLKELPEFTKQNTQWIVKKERRKTYSYIHKHCDGEYFLNTMFKVLKKFMQNNLKIYAFIDSQNLHLAIQDTGWEEEIFSTFTKIP